MHWIYLIHEFHNLSWITEINFSTTFKFIEMHLYIYINACVKKMFIPPWTTALLQWLFKCNLTLSGLLGLNILAIQKGQWKLLQHFVHLSNWGYFWSFWMVICLCKGKKNRVKMTQLGFLIRHWIEHPLKFCHHSASCVSHNNPYFFYFSWMVNTN